MANFANNTFTRCSTIYLGMICMSLLVLGECKSQISSGRKISNYPFSEKIANPCKAKNAAALLRTSSKASNLKLYNSVILSLNRILVNLDVMAAAEPSLSTCPGMYIETFPEPPPLANLTGEETIVQLYDMSLSLTAHFHFLLIGRQLPQTGVRTKPTVKTTDSPTAPSWTFRLCGNETNSLPTAVIGITKQLGATLCTLVTRATDDQKKSFQSSLHRLQETSIMPPKNFCSAFQFWDCVLTTSAKVAINQFIQKLNELIVSETTYLG